MTRCPGESLTEKITTALAQLRAARTQGELERELTWSYMLDRLLTLSGGGLAVEFRICTTPAVFLTGNMFPPGRTFEEPQMIHANWRVVNWGKFLPRFTTCPEMKG